jgi:hypothetical protein
LLSQDLDALCNLAQEKPLERRWDFQLTGLPFLQVLKGHIGLDTVIFPTGTTGEPHLAMTAFTLISHHSVCSSDLNMIQM